jgi:hypothetical protein
MHVAPFGLPGRFFRGNLHTHSTNSDGARTPAAVVAAYQDHGYDFLALTDHFLARYNFPLTDTRALRTSSFTTLLGAELHAPRIAARMDWHLVAVGLPLNFAPTMTGETGPELAARAVAAGAWVGIAHPARDTLPLEEALSIEVANAIEVYNEGSAYESDRGESWYLCELMLARGRRVQAFAADDAHFISTRPVGFAAWVQVRAEALTPEAILAGLKAGAYYSSQGPEIHDLVMVGNELTVSCSPAQVIIVSGPTALARAFRGEAVTSATLSLKGFEQAYCRVTIIDRHGKRAWSNPIWHTEQ